jgi:hypothetical protein
MKGFTALFSLSTIIYSLATISFLLINCNRDNPFDINSTNFTPGKKPHVDFVDSVISGYLFDTVNITITWTDTALGGKIGAVKRFYIDWDGDGNFSDSFSSTNTDTLTFSRVFNQQSNLIRIKAIDFENDTSDTDSAWLEIKQSTPVITSINAPATIEMGALFTINLNSTDIGGAIISYHWSVDEKIFSRTTDTNSLTLSFDQVGDKTILVKARDNKKIESAQRVISIRVIDPTDTVGPQIAFLSPLSADTVRTRDCVISLQVTDVSGVSGVTLNDAIAMQKVGLAWRGTVSLNQGENILTATAIDSKGYKNTVNIQVYYSQANIDQTPPVVLLLAPLYWTDTVNTGSLIVKLLARDESGVAGIFLDNEKMNSDYIDSSYSTVMALQEGSNRFIIRSVDSKGNTRLDTLLVVWTKDAVDTVPPVITITEPRYLQHIADSVMSIQGTVADASEIASVKVNGIEAVMHYPIWSSICNLKPGYDTITITATDGSINQNSSQKAVIVIRNKPPFITNAPQDTFISLNASTTFDAIASDDDTALVFSLTRTPITHGTASPLVSTISKTSFTYTASSVGIDTFNLFVADSWGDIDTVKWRIVVLASIDSMPIFTTDLNTLPNTITALETCLATIHAQDPRDKSLIYTISKPAPAGFTIDSLSGKITFIPIVSDTGTRAIIIQATNGQQTSSFTWNVTIYPPSWPPTLFSPGNQTINENQKLQLILSATDLNHDPLEFSFGSPFPEGAQLDSNQFTWTPTLSDAGVYSLVFVVRERNRTPSLCDSQTITITVNNVNQKPVLSTPGTINGVVNQAMAFTLSATDPDNDNIVITMTNAPSGSVLNANKFSWTPSFSNAGTYYVKFIASDALLSDTITVAVRINSANGAPVLTSPGNKAIPENQQLQFTLTASDPNNDSLIFSVNNSPSGSTLNGRLFSWRPNYTQSGTYTVTFYVRDNVIPPLVDSTTISIVVNNVNAPPVLTSPGNKTINEKALLAFDLTATDIDNNTLTFGMINAPQGAALATKRFTWTPSYAQSGTYKITFYVADNAVATLRDSQTITVIVNNTNRPPVFTDSTTKSVNENVTVSFQLMANDPDGTPVTYLSTNLPAGATVTPAGQFSWTPNFTQARSYRITFIAVDSSNAAVILKDTASITVNVINVNRPPVFTDSTAKTCAETQTLNFQLQANDPDANPLHYISTNLPTGATLSLTGVFSWTPKISDAGSYTVRFIARDSSVVTAVLSDTATIRITISNTNPGLPLLVSPTDNGSSQPKSIAFKWNRSLYALGYFLQVARDIGFTNLFFQDSTLTDTMRTVTGFANNTAYYWRVRALNSGGRSGWTTQRSFSTIPSFALSITASNGTVTTTPTPGPFDSATVVTLSAIPATGYHFDKWSGDAVAKVTPTSVTMNAPKSVTANFSLLSYQLTVSAEPSTGGTITAPIGSFPKEVNHGAATPITISPNPGYNFVNWTVLSGTATFGSATSVSTTVTLTGNAVVQANFSAVSYSLSVGAQAGGSITTPTYSPVNVLHGASTFITAAPEAGFVFVNWTVTNGTADIANPNGLATTVTLTSGDATVQANFVASITDPPSP